MISLKTPYIRKLKTWIIAFSQCLDRKLEIYEKPFKIPDLLFTLQEGRAHKLKCWKTLKPKSEPITCPVSYLLLIPVRRQEILLNYKPPSNFWNISATFWDLFFALRQGQVDEDWMNSEIQMNTFFNRFLSSSAFLRYLTKFHFQWVPIFLPPSNLPIAQNWRDPGFRPGPNSLGQYKNVVQQLKLQTN